MKGWGEEWREIKEHYISQQVQIRLQWFGLKVCSYMNIENTISIPWNHVHDIDI